MDRFIISSSPRALNKRAADINRNVIKTGRLLADFQLIIGEEGQANPCRESNLTPNVFDRRLFFKRKTEKTDKKKDAKNFTVWTRVRAAGLDKSAVTDRVGSKRTAKIPVLFSGRRQTKQQGKKEGCHFPIAEICRVEV
ncbi:hypothetical protein ACFC0X_14915 [Paenibacillus chitinolyticus]|uniref:hypothetical protein n=1 Tax=Paenibacillus chitinolyticus TaxID=79263 RepID=UPI0035E1AB50